jgi:hypothetical protein
MGSSLKSDGPREVIAHFSRPYLVLGWFGWLGITAAGLYFLWGEIASGPVVGSQDWMGHSPDKMGYALRAMVLVTLCAGMLSFLPRMLRQARGALSAGADALWIENGRIIYADRKLLDAPLADIASVAFVEERIYGTKSIIPQYAPWIVIQFKNGKRTKLPPCFVEKKNDIVAVLKRKLSLPATGAGASSGLVI